MLPDGGRAVLQRLGIDMGNPEQPVPPEEMPPETAGGMPPQGPPDGGPPMPPPEPPQEEMPLAAQSAMAARGRNPLGPQ